MAFRYRTDTLLWSYLIKLLLDKFSFNAHTHNPSLLHSPKGLSHTMLWRRPSQPMINCHVFLLNCLAFQVMGESELPLAFVIVHKICSKAPHKYVYLLTTIVPPPPPHYIYQWVRYFAMLCLKHCLCFKGQTVLSLSYLIAGIPKLLHVYHQEIQNFFDHAVGGKPLLAFYIN